MKHLPSCRSDVLHHPTPHEGALWSRRGGTLVKGCRRHMGWGEGGERRFEDELVHVEVWTCLYRGGEREGGGAPPTSLHGEVQ